MEGLDKQRRESGQEYTGGAEESVYEMRQRGVPDGARFVVEPPNSVPTGSRRDTSETFAWGGAAGWETTPDWVIEGRKRAIQRLKDKKH